MKKRKQKRIKERGKKREERNEPSQLGQPGFEPAQLAPRFPPPSLFFFILFQNR
jgi:hypothetical protein